MKINSLMIPDPITITENASIQEALELMKVNSIRHLPVVETGNRLKGLVTLADLKQGFLPSMLGDVSLADLIIKNPIVVRPDDDVESAARLIYKHKIGGMPVVKNDKLVGIITETDILRAFIDMMGLLTASSRIDLVVGDEPGAFRNVLQIINDNGGDIINVGITGRE
ncbi:MAG: CBS domain-containing protein, partial [Desulfobacterales bacterium]